MRVSELQPGPHVAWELSGVVLSFGGGVDVDLAAEEGDNQTIIDISRRGAGLVRGMGEGYVACVLIPPRQYAQSEGQEEPQPVPLNVEAVELKLWQFLKSEKEV
jgi:hypothetical protein